MDTFTLSLGRWPWVIRAMGRNPLVRFSDRVEAVLLVLVFGAAVLLIPIAGAVGTAVYEARAQVYAEEAQTRHAVPATAIEDSIFIVQRYAQSFRVQARWHAGGVEHFGAVELSREAKAGDRLDVWVDGRGNQVSPPAPTSRSGIDAMFAGAGAWLIAMTGIAGSSAFVCAQLTRRRYRGWDREWAALVSDGGGRTGSQT
jgi:hypothetical protein